MPVLMPMGGMTIVALAEHYPELFGDRVMGVSLIATTAGGLDPSRVRVVRGHPGMSRQGAQRGLQWLAP